MIVLPIHITSMYFLNLVAKGFLSRLKLPGKLIAGIPYKLLQVALIYVDFGLVGAATAVTLTDLLFLPFECGVRPEVFRRALSPLVALRQVLVGKTFLVADGVVHVLLPDGQAHDQAIRVEERHGLDCQVTPPGW